MVSFCESCFAYFETAWKSSISTPQIEGSKPNKRLVLPDARAGLRCALTLNFCCSRRSRPIGRLRHALRNVRGLSISGLACGANPAAPHCRDLSGKRLCRPCTIQERTHQNPPGIKPTLAALGMLAAPGRGSWPVVRGQQFEIHPVQSLASPRSLFLPQNTGHPLPAKARPCFTQHPNTISAWL